MSMVLHCSNGVEYYSSSIIDDTGTARHFFSTRRGGASSGEYSSLNLGIFTSDNEDNIIENYRRILKGKNMNMEKLTYLYQVHGDKFHVVDSLNLTEIRASDGDALVTAEKGIPIGVMTADCIPVILLDPVRGCAAAIHAGWKGTDLGIVKKVAEYMKNDLGCSTDNIRAAIGPGIGPCCFEVGDEVAEKFSLVYEKNNRKYVDLWSENEAQLKNFGIKPENIDKSEKCTLCSLQTFFSYRGEKGNTGRMGSFIELV